VFVRGAMAGVLREALLASVLVSLIIAVSLGSWRSVVMVCTSIPLAIFSAIVGLRLTGHTLNIMTLGGLALAIGMLVDDAAVEVENIHRNQALGKPLTAAILEGARQIALPAVVATLAICVVFFPVLLLAGPARFLFVPLALAVVLAMVASYVLSRTLVPVLARLLLVGSAGRRQAGWLAWIRGPGFDRLRGGYGRMLSALLGHPRFALGVAAVVALASLALPPVVGTDFFPTVDAGLMKLHLRAPAGTRIERTEEMVAAVEGRIRELIPAAELDTINAMIGVPVFYNLAFVQTDNVGGMDAELLIALRKGHRPTTRYRSAIRRMLAEDFPGATGYFQPADLVTQVLNFGLAAPIDVQVEHANLDQAYGVALRLRDQMRAIPGTTDVQVSQVLDYPTLRVEVDRQRAAQLGLSQRDVASSLLISLSSSGLFAPSFFLNPANNVNYNVAVKTPLTALASVTALMRTPLGSPAGAGPVVLGGLPHAPSATLASVASLAPQTSFSQISHHTIQRVLDVTAGVEGRDLGSVLGDLDDRIAALGKLPPGMRIVVRGQNEVMGAAFRSLGLGMLLAVALVYCLMVVLFQSWLDPLLIMLALPGAAAGVLWMLVLTGTTINVESLMGSIMAVGIAVSNSVLLVSFANERAADGSLSARQAALEAARTRLRPVLITALAMTAGMVPMALGLGEAGEQNAPLGRAVIGGLCMATVFTLLVVPVAYSVLHRRGPKMQGLGAHLTAEVQT
jgi:multidrug efflux pump subunit AcrB